MIKSNNRVYKLVTVQSYCYDQATNLPPHSKHLSKVKIGILVYRIGNGHTNVWTSLFQIQCNMNRWTQIFQITKNRLLDPVLLFRNLLRHSFYVSINYYDAIVPFGFRLTHGNFLSQKHNVDKIERMTVPGGE